MLHASQQAAAAAAAAAAVEAPDSQYFSTSAHSEAHMYTFQIKMFYRKKKKIESRNYDRTALPQVAITEVPRHLCTRRSIAV